MVYGTYNYGGTDSGCCLLSLETVGADTSRWPVLYTLAIVNGDGGYGPYGHRLLASVIYDTLAALL